MFPRPIWSLFYNECSHDRGEPQKFQIGESWGSPFRTGPWLTYLKTSRLSIGVTTSNLRQRLYVQIEGTPKIGGHCGPCPLRRERSVRGEPLTVCVIQLLGLISFDVT